MPFKKNDVHCTFNLAAEAAAIGAAGVATLV